jgi:sec-independent protein translocase protein TatA
MIPGMPQVGGVELLILLAIILLFFGARRVPELGRSLGQSMREFRKGASEDEELPSDEETPHLDEADNQRGHSEEVRDEQRVS